VFGLDVRCAFDAPGLGGRGATEDAPRVLVGCISEGELESTWRRRGAERIGERRFDDGSDAVTIHRNDAGSLRLFAAGYGSFLIPPDGSRIACTPARVASWQWQRYLIGQALPIAAVLHGLEVLHASAVAVGDAAIGFVAGSGVGKTSLALNMVRRGARFVTDDVVALGWRRDELVVHPGPAVTNLRSEEHDRMGLPPLGRVVGRDSYGLRVVVPRESRALPLRALYLLDRVPAGDAPAFARLDPGFRQMLETGFEFLIADGRRAQNRLDVYAAIASRVPVFRVSVPPAVDAARLAACVEAHAADVVGGEG
jgi:hypothetical protein